MFSKVKSLGLFGLDVFLVDIEASIEKSMPIFDIVGLPDTAVKESRNRVRSAIKNCGFEFPPNKITVNLAPANVKKEGSVYDLPILIALLSCSGQLQHDLSKSAFLGEVSLSGEVRPIKGVLPMALKAKEYGIENLYVPFGNEAESSVVDGINIFAVKHISSLVSHLSGVRMLPYVKYNHIIKHSCVDILDFSQVKGQMQAKRALEIAAAGGHNVILIGPPGAGKSMLAKRIPTILPQMTKRESIEVTKIHSIAGLLPKNTALITERPFRAPHHTISAAGLAGGGTIPRPGEISLAHNGVLFLDELPEFSRSTMEILRQPIEDGVVTISRVHGTLTYPCNIMFIAAMNPCPCGYFGHPTKSCTCSERGVNRYLAKVSGPLLDRIDLHVEVSPVLFEEISSDIKTETSAEIRARVNKAKSVQNERYGKSMTTCNARISQDELQKFCVLSDNAKTLLSKAFDSLGLSARAYTRILKVSRTIADLASSEEIKSSHLAESIQYRSLDRKYYKNV